MKKALVIVAAASAMLASCQMAEIDSINSVQKGTTTIKAVIENEETRTALNEDANGYKVVWQEGDEIALIDANMTDPVTFKAAEGGSSYTYFTTTDSLVLAAPLTAYYPAYTKNGLAAIQNYEGFVTPMVGNSTTTTINFKNTCGLLKFNITTTASGISVKSIDIKADQGMSGAFTLNGDAAVVSGTDGVTIDCGEGVAIGSTPVAFLASVPANTYTNLSITVNTTDGKTQTLKTKSGKSIVVERAKVHEGTLAFDNFKAVEIGGTVTLPAGKEFNAAVKQLADEIATDATIDPYITKIVFETNSARTSDKNISDISSDKPLYATYDKISGAVILSTPAEKIALPEDASYMFAGLGLVEEIVNIKALDTSAATDMSYMFSMSGCDSSRMAKLDVSSFNTANVTMMSSMFRSLNVKEINLSGFNTSACEAMDYMFFNCHELEEIDCSSFNTELIASFDYMFSQCKKAKKINVSSFNTENAATFNYMFGTCWALESQDLSNFNTENATSFKGLFYWNKVITSINVSGWNTESVTTMQHMFNSCYELPKIDLSSFSSASLPDKTGVNLDYFLQQMGALQEVWFGPDFYKPTNILPYTTMWIYSKTQAPVNHRTASCNTTGTLIIHCCQECCDWLSQTGLRWINSGASDQTPVPVTFLDITTGATLTPTNGWRAD